MTDYGNWQPLTLVQTAALLVGFDGRWWIAGGWATDLFLGRQTREHADVEISVLRADQSRLREHLVGWDIHIAHDGRGTAHRWSRRDINSGRGLRRNLPGRLRSCWRTMRLTDGSTGGITRCRCRWSSSAE
jgi:hypothetical protein